METRFILTAFIALLSFTGCEAKKEVIVRQTETVVQKPALSKEALARLEEADKFDGKTDHVVGKCYVCGLGMDGSDKYTVSVEGYTAHLCSKMCQKEFNESTEKIVLGTEIPKGVKPE